ncbi:RNA cytidine acetyltransferase [Phymastichus coffea]|uniref:RNA cytidine acetyltransferase n=1 Tax=Phymastichus coffea TaxID=108790 RepID=UPI00273CE07E|nr:RNA cytidine acetyltransferase [Phymastichus coffea]
MVRKKIDNRIRLMMENGVANGHRTMFIIIGEKAKDQIVLLHNILMKSTVKAQPTVLWCYKKDLGFSSHRKKKMKALQKKAKSGKINFDDDDPFDLFIMSTKIRYCYYNETHKILGSTYDICILQDFEALTPNLLARTLETVQGGGLIIFLLQSINSLKQLYTMNMDVHQRFRTEAHQDVVCRFNERFLLSLASCDRCLVVDDQLQVLPLSSHNLTTDFSKKINPIDTSELNMLKKSLQDTQPVGAIVNCCKTTDQAKALLKFIEAISEKTLRSTISLTAARGRGKSAALGLAIAGAIAFGYSNIYITSPSPENLKTVFEFISKGFEALNYQEHTDYEFFQSTNPEFNQATIRVNVFRDHRQTIQYIHPVDAKDKLSLCELLVIDEAAAIPLPHVKAMLGPYLTFMASTINGYEGTGRSLTLKLLQQLRAQSAYINTTSRQKDLEAKAIIGRQLQELVLEEPIRYGPGDSVEKWLCDLLCLDVTTTVPSISSGCPTPDDCQLYYINRDTLFSYHKASEKFLQRMMALCVSSHYKNSPNDLQMMSDAPAHHLFCLLGPIDPDRKTLPEILVVIQVCLEGEIKKSTISDGLGRGRRAAGDLIPWTIAQQFQDEDFPSLCGARIVRIATHPDYQSMGYGGRALELLRQYYQVCFPNLEADEPQEVKQIEEDEVDLLEETIEPKSSLPPLLLKLTERRPEKLDYVGVSFGVTEPLLKFWKRAKFVPVYLRQTANDITGEHSCIMLSSLQSEANEWLPAYWKDFRKRFITLLASAFREYPPSLALAILTNNTIKLPNETLQKYVLDTYFTGYDVARLEKYGNNMSDYHLIMDLIPPLAKLYFLNLMKNIHFSAVQSAILLSLGLQHKTVDQVVKELNKTSTNDSNVLVASQVLGLFNRIIRKSTSYLNEVIAETVGCSFKDTKDPSNALDVNPQNAADMHKELEVADKQLKKEQKKQFQKLHESIQQYAIKGSENEWSNALKSSKKSKNLISIKTGEKKIAPSEENDNIYENSKETMKKSKKRKHSL